MEIRDGISPGMDGGTPSPAAIGTQDTAEEKGGTVSFANGFVTYRSAPDFNGEDRFFYLVNCIVL